MCQVKPHPYYPPQYEAKFLLGTSLVPGMGWQGGEGKEEDTISKPHAKRHNGGIVEIEPWSPESIWGSRQAERKPQFCENYGQLCAWTSPEGSRGREAVDATGRWHCG